MIKRHLGLIVTFVIFLIVCIDQLIKIYVKTHFDLYEQVEVFPWFKLYFIENDGMAFGLDFLGTAPLAIFRIVATGLFIYYLRKIIQKQYPLGMLVCISLIIAGAIGNLIDNLCYGAIFSESLPYPMGQGHASLVPFGEGYGSPLSGKVVDIFYFPLFTWPDSFPLVGGNIFFGAVFNFADASINCGAVALILFYYKRLFQSNATSQPTVPSAK